MVKKDKLHTVIHALSMNEKRYFKGYAKQHGESSGKEYLKLFDLLEKQENYDETKILKILKYKKKDYKLSVLKNYLLKTIIKSMEAYHNEGSVTRKVNSMLEEIEFYYDKGLMELWKKSLDRAEKFALKHQLYPELIRINWWLRRYKVLVNAYDEIPENLKRTNGYLSILQSEFQYEKIYSELLYAVNLEYGSQEQSKRYESILEAGVIKNPDRALSVDSKVKYHEILTLYNSINQEMATAYEHASAAVELVESKSELIKAGSIRYGFPLLTNLMILQLVLRKYPDLLKTINKLKKETQRTKVYGKRIVAGMRFLTYSHEMFYLIRVGKFKEAVDSSQVLVDSTDLENLPESIDQPALVVSLFNIAVSYFGINDYRSALYWVNRILNDKGMEQVRPDVYSGAKIFFLILHFELGNQELLEYAFRSTYRYLVKKRVMEKFEHTVLSHLRKIPKMDTGQELQGLYKSLRVSLLEISEDPYVYQALNAYRIISWLDSKIESRPYNEIVQEKVKSGIEF